MPVKYSVRRTRSCVLKEHIGVKTRAPHLTTLQQGVVALVGPVLPVGPQLPWPCCAGCLGAEPCLSAPCQAHQQEQAGMRSAGLEASAAPVAFVADLRRCHPPW